MKHGRRQVAAVIHIFCPMYNIVQERGPLGWIRTLVYLDSRRCQLWSKPNMDQDHQGYKATRTLQSAYRTFHMPLVRRRW